MAAPKQSKIPWANSLDVQHVGKGEYFAQYPTDFCYGTRAHGGHLISLMERAVRLHFRDNPPRPTFEDVLDLKVHWLRMSTFGATTIEIEDVSVSKTNATVQVRLLQADRLNVIALMTVGNIVKFNGPSFDTQWKLDPPPRPADIVRMSRDEDPEWISYQVPWHPKSYLRIMSNAKMFFPYLPHPNPTVRDMWMTPVDSDPNFGWTNDHLSYIADMTFSPLENWQESGVASHANMIRAAKAQKVDREAGKPQREKIPGLSPFTSYTMSMNIDVKKRLPAQGVKWLFTRTSSRDAGQGRMDWDVTIHDADGALIAIAHNLHQTVELKNNPMPGGTNAKTGKPKA